MLRLNCASNHVEYECLNNAATQVPCAHAVKLKQSKFDPRKYQFYLLFASLPKLCTPHPPRDALFGSLLFLSVFPILSPAVGFPGSCTPTCLILIKLAPEGIHGCMEREETAVGQHRVGAPAYRAEMSHLSGDFASPVQPESDAHLTFF